MSPTLRAAYEDNHGDPLDVVVSLSADAEPFPYGQWDETSEVDQEELAKARSETIKNATLVTTQRAIAIRNIVGGEMPTISLSSIQLHISRANLRLITSLEYVLAADTPDSNEAVTKLYNGDSQMSTYQQWLSGSLFSGWYGHGTGVLLQEGSVPLDGTVANSPLADFTLESGSMAWTDQHGAQVYSVLSAFASTCSPYQPHLCPIDRIGVAPFARYGWFSGEYLFDIDDGFCRLTRMMTRIDGVTPFGGPGCSSGDPFPPDHYGSLIGSPYDVLNGSYEFTRGWPAVHGTRPVMAYLSSYADAIAWYSGFTFVFGNGNMTYPRGSPYEDYFRAVVNAGAPVPGTGHYMASISGSPADAFNVIGIGGAAYAGVMSEFTSYRPPTSRHLDRKKPDILAPECARTWDQYNLWQADSCGSSIAAPHVAGAVSLLLQRRPSLKARADAVRASLIATARDVAPDPNVTPPDSTWGDLEGARLLQSLDSSTLIGASSNDWRMVRTLRYSELDHGPQVLATIHMDANTESRLALSWLVKGQTGAPNYEPATELDMWVSDETGAVPAWSMSRDSTVEFIKLANAGTPHIYTVRVQRWRSNPQHDVPTTLAWWKTPGVDVYPQPLGSAP